MRFISILRWYLPIPMNLNKKFISYVTKYIVLKEDFSTQKKMAWNMTIMTTIPVIIWFAILKLTALAQLSGIIN